jgi:hypothetical protein
VRRSLPLLIRGFGVQVPLPSGCFPALGWWALTVMVRRLFRRALPGYGHIVPQPRPASARALAMRTARVILISQVVSLAICAPVLFYVLAFSSQPHHVGSATLTTFITIVVLGGTTWWLYRIKRAQANRLDDTEPEGPASVS